MSDVVDSAKSDSKSRSVPAGYQQTEVGLIPNDWEVKPFTQVTDLITCGIAATPVYVPEAKAIRSSQAAMSKKDE